MQSALKLAVIERLVHIVHSSGFTNRLGHGNQGRRGGRAIETLSGLVAAFDLNLSGGVDEIFELEESQILLQSRKGAVVIAAPEGLWIGGAPGTDSNQRHPKRPECNEFHHKETSHSYRSWGL